MADMAAAQGEGYALWGTRVCRLARGCGRTRAETGGARGYVGLPGVVVETRAETAGVGGERALHSLPATRPSQAAGLECGGSLSISVLLVGLLGEPHTERLVAALDAV